MTTLTKTRTVMRLACATPACACRQVGVNGLVQFIATDDDTEAVYRGVGILQRDWVDMGEPETITVTIEPGDHLNP